jgi:hypothetical protein
MIHSAHLKTAGDKTYGQATVNWGKLNRNLSYYYLPDELGFATVEQ